MVLMTDLKRLYLVCALLTTVSAGHMLKKRKKVRSVRSFIYLIDTSDTHYLNNVSVSFF